MLETEFAIKFGNWIEENKPGHHQNFEFKVVNGGTFNLRLWRNSQPHQPRSLRQASCEIGVYHKISDMSRGNKPFDAFFSVHTENLLVIYFNKYKEFFIIPIDDVPYTDSVSYKYCMTHFKPYKLLDKKEQPILDF